MQYFNGGVDTPMGAREPKTGTPNLTMFATGKSPTSAGAPNTNERLARVLPGHETGRPSIELLSSYPTPGVLDGAGDWIGFVSPHHYECDDLAGVESDLARFGR